MSACFSLLGNFEEWTESLMSSHVYFAKNSTFFFSRLVLISFFCVAFFGSRLWKVFLTSSMSIWWNLKTWRVILINLILRWSLYLSSIFKIWSCSDEWEHLYPLFGIFKIGMFIKYSLNVWAIWSSREINKSENIL